jgi:putative DNA methylase
MTRSLIEQWFPAPAIGAESLRERGASSALPPTSFLHVWWARRPLTASRAVVVASLLPAWPSDADAESDPPAAKVLAGLRSEFPGGEDDYHRWYLEALGIKGDPVAGRQAIQAANAAGVKLDGNGYGYRRAFTATPNAADTERLHKLAALRADVADPPVVLDPFAGGGSIPFEAGRYGCQTIAGELNPVATAILQGTVALPAQLGPEFADEIARWGTRWAERVRRRLDPFFPLQGSESIAAYIWAHTVPCPTTGRPTPLAPDFWLARGLAGREVAISLHVDRVAGEYTLAIVDGADAAAWGKRSTYKKGTGTSIWTEETFSGEYIRAQGVAGRVGAMLLAVSVTRPSVSGRQFRVPSPSDLAAVQGAEQELARRRPVWEVADLIPNEAIFEGKETKRSVEMGLTRWSDMFTPRQLITNVTALEELREIANEAQSELGEEKGRAVALYLGLALDKAADYNGILSSWHASRVTVRNTFDRHDFAYKWTFAEFDGAHALLPWAVAQVSDAYRGIAGLARDTGTLLHRHDVPAATILRGSATALRLPDASIDAVVTDPPYYDNVMYAECSDYFYVWLKRSLGDTWPQFCDLVLTDKEDEAVANPSLFKDVATPRAKGTNRSPDQKSPAELADARYEHLLTAAFAEAHRVLKPSGVLTVMFTHKRVDAWDTLGMALLESGFTIDSSWPVHTEAEHSLHQAKKNAASSTVMLTCHKRQGAARAYWADIRSEIERAAEEAVHRFAADGLAGVDLTLATFGPVLSVLSQRWPVFTGELGPDGLPQVIRPDQALDLARERVASLKKRGLLGGRDVDFDRVTDWYLLAWSDFSAAEFPSGEALKLSLATHLELADLVKTYKVIQSSSGTVTLLAPAQRHTVGAINPDSASWPILIDALHCLMLVYDEQGLPAARAWLTRTGLGDDARFADLLTAALAAIPRTREKGVFVRPEARILDSLRSALFEAVPLPPEKEPAEQMAFSLDGAPDELASADIARTLEEAPSARR